MNLSSRFDNFQFMVNLVSSLPVLSNLNYCEANPQPSYHVTYKYFNTYL